MSYLQPMDTRQYLYCLKPKPEYAEKAGVIKGVTVIGKLDIVWKTNLGERGRLQTSQLQRMVLGCFSICMLLPKSKDLMYFILVCLLLFCPCVSSRLQATEISGCLWRWFLTRSTLKNLSTSSVKSPTAGKNPSHTGRPWRDEIVGLQPAFFVVVKEPWTWCWRCVTPDRSTGVEFQGGSWGNWAPVPSSLCPSHSSPPSRACRYESGFLGKLSADVLVPLSLADVFHLFVSEYFRIEAHRHVSEEDVRIRRHRTSVCGLPVHEQRVLGVLFTFSCVCFRYEWTNSGILRKTLTFHSFCNLRG